MIPTVAFRARPQVISVRSSKFYLSEMRICHNRDLRRNTTYRVPAKRTMRTLDVILAPIKLRTLPEMHCILHRQLVQAPVRGRQSQRSASSGAHTINLDEYVPLTDVVRDCPPGEKSSFSSHPTRYVRVRATLSVAVSAFMPPQCQE